MTTRDDPTPLTAEEEAEVRERMRGWSGSGLVWRSKNTSTVTVERLLATLDAARSQREPDVDLREAVRYVVQWVDNVTEWPVPPPLNEELRALRDLLTADE